MCGGGDAPEIQETAEEVALAGIARAQWDRYKSVLAPFEDEYLANMRTDAGDQANLTGQTAAAVGRVMDERQGDVERGAFAGGVNPNSGQFKAALGGLTVDRGEKSGSAMGRASQALDDQNLQNLQNAISIGRGQAVDATRDMTTMASDAAGEAVNSAAMKADRQDSLGSTVMSAAGMGLAGWKNRKKED